MNDTSAITLRVARRRHRQRVNHNPGAYNCACGKPAAKFKDCSPVCERCDRIEGQYVELIGK